MLPTWFSSDVIARIPAPGNVICGGYEDVIYQADWHVLGTGESPRVDVGVLADSIDFADLISEREHGYAVSRGSGWTDMKILPDPRNPRSDVFDGGRILFARATESFTLRNLAPGRTANFAFRSAPTGGTSFRVRVGGEDIATIALVPKDGWDERVIAIAADRVTPSMVVEIVNDGPGELPLFHAWVGQ